MNKFSGIQNLNQLIKAAEEENQLAVSLNGIDNSDVSILDKHQWEKEQNELYSCNENIAVLHLQKEAIDAVLTGDSGFKIKLVKYLKRLLPGTGVTPDKLNQRIQMLINDTSFIEDIKKNADSEYKDIEERIKMYQKKRDDIITEMNKRNNFSGEITDTSFSGIMNLEGLLNKYSNSYEREPVRNDDTSLAVRMRKQELQDQKQMEKAKEIALQKRRQQELKIDYQDDSKKRQDLSRNLQEEERYEDKNRLRREQEMSSFQL